MIVFFFWKTTKTEWSIRSPLFFFSRPNAPLGLTLFSTFFNFFQLFRAANGVAYVLCICIESDLKFQNPKSRSEPFILFSILICAWRSNFIFFWIFLLFIKYFTKLLIQRWLLILLFCAATVGSTIL